MICTFPVSIGYHLFSIYTNIVDFGHFLLQCVAAEALRSPRLCSSLLFTLTVPADLISNPGSIFPLVTSVTATDVNPEKATHT